MCRKLFDNIVITTQVRFQHLLDDLICTQTDRSVMPIYVQCHIPDCGKTFSTIYNLRTHIKSHDRVCNEACQILGCTAKFSTRQLLEDHMKQQHPADKPYRC